MEHVTASTGTSDIVDIWNYRIQKHRKNYGVALNLFENTIMRQDSIVLATLRQSLTASQKDYYSEKSKRLEQENKKIEYMYIALSLLLVIILLSVSSSSTEARSYCPEGWTRWPIFRNSLEPGLPKKNKR